MTAHAEGFAPASEDVVYTGIPMCLFLRLYPKALESNVKIDADASVLDPMAPARVHVTLEQIARIPSQSVSSSLSSLLTSTTPGISSTFRLDKTTSTITSASALVFT